MKDYIKREKLQKKNKLVTDTDNNATKIHWQSDQQGLPSHLPGSKIQRQTKKIHIMISTRCMIKESPVTLFEDLHHMHPSIRNFVSEEESLPPKKK